jgi:hypothetical protein
MIQNKRFAIAGAFIAGVALTYTSVAVMTSVRAQEKAPSQDSPQFGEAPQPPGGGFGRPGGGQGGFGSPSGFGGGPGGPGGGQRGGGPGMGMPMMGAPVMQVSGNNIFILRGNSLLWYTGVNEGRLKLNSQTELPRPPQPRDGGFGGDQGGPPPPPDAPQK